MDGCSFSYASLLGICSVNLSFAGFELDKASVTIKGTTKDDLDNVDERIALPLVIKLLPNSRGKGIAHKALLFAIEHAFIEGKAKLVYLDSDLDNLRKWKLYGKFVLMSKPRPDYIEEGKTYLELKEVNGENHL